MTLFYGHAEDLLQFLQARAILGDMCVSHETTDSLKLKRENKQFSTYVHVLNYQTGILEKPSTISSW